MSVNSNLSGEIALVIGANRGMGPAIAIRVDPEDLHERKWLVAGAAERTIRSPPTRAR
jgi:hypothetical protein